MSVDFPEHQPGTRPIHTKGIAVAGQFRATRDAKEYCIAPQFDGSWTPVVVRFSNGNGQPDPDGRLQPRGMAVKLYAGGTREPDPGAEHQDQATVAGLRVEEQPIVPAVSGGRVEETDLICMSAPVFMAQSAERVLEFEKAYRPRQVRPPSLLKRLASLARMSPLPPLEAGVTMSGNDGFLEWARRYEPAAGVPARALAGAAPGELRARRVPRGARLRGGGRRRHPSHGAVLLRAVRRCPERRATRGDPVADRVVPQAASRSTSTGRRSIPTTSRRSSASASAMRRAASTSGCRSPTRGTTPRIPPRRGR